MSEEELTLQSVYEQLRDFRLLVQKQFISMDEKIADLRGVVSQAAESDKLRSISLMLEGKIGDLFGEMAAVRRHLDLYMSGDQMKNHSHDGVNSKRVDYADLEGNNMAEILRMKADVAKGYSLAGKGKTGDSVLFQKSFSGEPLVLAQLNEAKDSQGNLVTRTEVSVSPIGFSFKAFSGPVELKGLAFTYLVWNPLPSSN